MQQPAPQDVAATPPAVASTELSTARTPDSGRRGDPTTAESGPARFPLSQNSLHPKGKTSAGGETSGNSATPPPEAEDVVRAPPALTLQASGRPDDEQADDTDPLEDFAAALEALGTVNEDITPERERELLEPEDVEMKELPAEAQEETGFPAVSDTHPFAGLYADVAVDQTPKTPIRKRLSWLTLDKIQKVRNETIAAITAPPAPNPASRKESGEPLTKFMDPEASYKENFFAVVVKLSGMEATATPVFREVTADDRGDLLYLQIDRNTRIADSTIQLNPHELYIGDVVAIRSIARRPDKTPESWSNTAPSLTNASDSFFRIDECSVLARTIVSGMAAERASGQRGNRYPFLVEGLTQVAYASKAVIKGSPKEDLSVSTFVPQVHPGQLLRFLRRGQAKREVLRRTHHSRSTWIIQPVVTAVSKRPEDVRRKYSITPKVFSTRIPEQEALQAVVDHVRFAVCATLALEDRYHDRRYFVGEVQEVQEAPNGSRTVSITIQQGVGADTHARFWTRGTPFAMEVDEKNTAQCVTRKSSSDAETVRINARITTPRFTTFKGQKVTLAQNAQDSAELARTAPSNKNIPEITRGDHALCALKAALGGSALPPLPPIHNPNPEVAVGGLLLSPEQKTIITTLSSDTFSGILVSCAFGSGKTSTAIMGVMERIRKKGAESKTLYSGMTNAAATSAVNAARKLDIARTLRVVRLISEANRTRLDAEYLTDDDFPLAWRRFFRTKVLEVDAARCVISDAILDMGAHLRNAGSLQAADLTFPALRQGLFQQQHKPKVALMPLFLDQFRPNLLVTTIASARATLGAKELDEFRRQIQLAVVDEASQLPIFALVTLSLLVPKARLALLGDIKQLPPHTPPELPRSLSAVAIGSILKDIQDNRIFPTLSLGTVFRCPSAVTTLLSSSFYDSTLTPRTTGSPVVSAFQAMGWPATFPIVFAQHNFTQVQDGSSILNEEEAMTALNIAERLRSVEPRSTIGKVGFYKATCNYLSIRAPPTIEVLTVDAAQGREFTYVLVLTSRTSGPTAFLADPLRVNVAISRTMTGCVIFGERNLLGTALTWRSVIEQIPPESFINV